MPQRYAVARRYLVSELAKQGVLASEAVRNAFLAVPREAFVAPALAAQSYTDNALPITEGQTISKPSVVARMLEALDLRGGNVLEIGTGSGYATALLAHLADEVYTLELEARRSLSLRARRVLQSLGIANVRFRTADGAEGWPDSAPFDRILVTAEAPQVPQLLYGQLTPGGRMVLPLKGRLVAVTVGAEGPKVEDQGPAIFVPFVSDRFT